MEENKFLKKYFDESDESGFKEVVFERQKHLDALKERLKKYYLTDEEINKLFRIIEDAEIEMEKVKRSFKPKEYTQENLSKFQKKLFDIQTRMKYDFEKKLNKTIKDKYMKAKKIVEKNEKKNKKENPFM